jgi:hypothetical protein
MSLGNGGVSRNNDGGGGVPVCGETSPQGGASFLGRLDKDRARSENIHNNFYPTGAISNLDNEVFSEKLGSASEHVESLIAGASQLKISNPNLSSQVQKYAHDDNLKKTYSNVTNNISMQVTADNPLTTTSPASDLSSVVGPPGDLPGPMDTQASMPPGNLPANLLAGATGADPGDPQTSANTTKKAKKRGIKLAAKFPPPTDSVASRH